MSSETASKPVRKLTAREIAKRDYLPNQLRIARKFGIVWQENTGNGQQPFHSFRLITDGNISTSEAIAFFRSHGYSLKRLDVDTVAISPDGPPSAES